MPQHQATPRHRATAGHASSNILGLVNLASCPSQVSASCPSPSRVHLLSRSSHMLPLGCLVNLASCPSRVSCPSHVVSLVSYLAPWMSCQTRVLSISHLVSLTSHQTVSRQSCVSSVALSLMHLTFGVSRLMNLEFGLIISLVSSQSRVLSISHLINLASPLSCLVSRVLLINLVFALHLSHSSLVSRPSRVSSSVPHLVISRLGHFASRIQWGVLSHQSRV